MKPKAIPEFQAKGEVARVYHEIRQCLRVSGVNLNFRTWGSFDKFLPAMWDGMRPNVESEIFERAADRLREDAVNRAGSLNFPADTEANNHGESRSYQIGAAIDLYHYINPKLLVFTSAVRLALQGERIGTNSDGDIATVPNGEPDKMFAMELESEKPENRDLRHLYSDIKRTLDLSQINSDYRTLSLWPDYLAFAWKRLKPICQSDAFKQASEELRETSRQLARTLPYRFSLEVRRVRELGENPDQVLKTTAQFEELLPSLILNIALLRKDRESRREGVDISGTPSAVNSRSESEWRSFQRRQKVVDLGSRFVSYIDEGKGEPVLLLHGIPTWSFLWADTIEVLKKKNYRVIAPDLLGFGYSDKRDCFDRSIGRQTDVIAGLLEKIGVDSAHVVAHDIGGGIALRLATFHAPRVLKLCVLNTVCYDSWPIEMMLQIGHPSMRNKLSASALLKVLKQALKMGFHARPSSEWLDGLLSPWRTEVGKLSLIRNASALNTNLTAELTPLLPRISVPTLILWGEEDRFQLVEYGERLAKDIPGARLKRISDARHFVMIDQPRQVHSEISNFLGQTAFYRSGPSLPGRRSGAAVKVTTSPRSKRMRSA